MARVFASASSQYLEGTPLVTSVPLTMGLRARVNQTTAYNCLMALCQSGGTDRLLIRARGDVGGDPLELAALDVPNGPQAISGGSYTSGEEMTLVVAMGASSWKFYKNATSLGTNGTSYSPSGINRVNIACETVSGVRYTYSDADLWDAFLTNVEWSAADVAAFAAGYSPEFIRPDARVHYWPLFGQSSPEPDLFKGGALTLGNSPTEGSHGRVVMPKMRGLPKSGTSPPPSVTYPQLERSTRGLLRGLALGRVAA